MAEMSVTLAGGEEVSLEMQVLAHGLRDLRPFWRIVFPLAQGWIRKQFKTQGVFGGEPWPQLKPGYAKAKQAKWGRRPLLVASGDLRREVNRPRQQASATGLVVYIDENIRDHHGPIARFHQEGTPTMERRPLLFEVLPPSAARELQGASEVYVDKLITQAAARHGRAVRRAAR